MRKIILAMQVSLDGFVEAPNSDMSWRNGDDAEEWMDFFEMVQSVDLFMLGSKMYPDYRNYWQKCIAAPSSCSANELTFAQIAEKSRHIVFSKTMKESGWTNTEINSNDLGLELAKIKNEKGGDIHVVGGAKFAASVIETGLVDEYRLNIYPVILGKGISFFHSQNSHQNLELISTKTLKSGVVIMRHKVK